MAKFKDYDHYIAEAQEFAQPMLAFFRECVHEACPEVVEEFKWSFPNFTYNGAILCNMAGFKKHVTFGFWLGGQMKDPKSVMIRTGNSGMGNFGKMTSMAELPNKEILIEYIREAMEMTDSGVKLPSQTSPKKSATAIDVPQILIDALQEDEVAYSTFNSFSQSHRNEYSEWISDAKTEKTQQKRLSQTMEWLKEGKPRNWKYMKNWQPAK